MEQDAPQTVVKLPVPRSPTSRKNAEPATVLRSNPGSGTP